MQGSLKLVNNYENGIVMLNKARVFQFLIVIALMINLIIGYHVHSAVFKRSGEDKGYKAIRQFARVLRLIRTNYVDDTKIEYDELIYGALQGMLSSLDRFSSFIEPDEYKMMMEETEGEFGGIGVVISIKDNVLTVVAPMEDTPGMRAGIMANDKIVRVNDKETTNLTLEQAVDLVKGRPGTMVDITVFRPSTRETKTFSIQRGIIELNTIKDARFIEPGIGYIRITQFNEKTVSTLRDSLNGLNKDKINGLIIDLRNNPGGLLSSAIHVSSLFIPRKQLIVFMEGRQESQKQEFHSSSEEKFLDFPIVILINEGSASGAEIVAGCLQDYGRALLVGAKSFGKGSVQSIIELNDGSAVRITTANYYTPGKRVIHENGVEPDFVVDISEEDSHKLSLQRAGAAGDVVDETEEIEDLQLMRSLEVLKDLIIATRGKKKDYARIVTSVKEVRDKKVKEH